MFSLTDVGPVPVIMKTTPYLSESLVASGMTLYTKLSKLSFILSKLFKITTSIGNFFLYTLGITYQPAILTV